MSRRSAPPAAQRPVARRTDLADRLRPERFRCGAARAGGFLRLERPGAGGLVQRHAAWRRPSPRRWRCKDFRYNAWYGAEKRAGPEGGRLSPDAVRPDRQQAAVDGGRTLRPAAGQPGDAPCLRRRLEHDRQMDRRAAEDVPGAHRRRHHGEICRLRMRRRLLRRHGHGRPRCIRRRSWRSICRTRSCPRKYGYPFKIRVPTKLGFKNPKFVTTIYVTNIRPHGFWTDRGYNWFSGI